MIPKNILYVWLPKGKEKPEKVKKCIKTWKEKMPDYNFIELNEETFIIDNKYFSDAFNNRHWAYASDYLRLKGLYEIGGIYMDTDVEVYKPLDSFLKHKCFTGFESINYPVCAVMGAEKGNKIIKELLEQYDREKFETHTNWWEYRTNTIIISEIVKKYIKCNNEFQENEIAVYPRKYFTCNDNGTVDEETYAKHLMMGNWVD